MIPSGELLKLQKLEKIHVRNNRCVEELLETPKRPNSDFFDHESQTVVELPNLSEVKLKKLFRLMYIWRSNQWMVFKFPNLTRVSIDDCDSLLYVFTSSMVGSLLQLQELHITSCSHMTEIVKAENVVQEDGKMKEIVLPHLKSLELKWLPCLKGFCLGKEDSSFPLLETLTLMTCPSILIFTEGKSATPKLKATETSFGLFSTQEEDINSFIKTIRKEFRGNWLD